MATEKAADHCRLRDSRGNHASVRSEERYRDQEDQHGQVDAENKTTRPPDGIPSFVQTALLLQRRNDSERFDAEIKISGHVDNDERVRNIWKGAVAKMSGRKVKPRSVIFNPKLTNRGAVKDVENLDSVDLEGYRELVTVREWDKGADTTAGHERKVEEEKGVRKRGMKWIIRR